MTTTTAGRKQQLFRKCAWLWLSRESFGALAGGVRVSPHRTEPWVADLSANSRVCKLLGYHCVADFDITSSSLSPLVWEILDKLQEPERALQAGECNTINIGLYQGGKDIRVWKVWYA